jgi:hypothetical protein
MTVKQLREYIRNEVQRVLAEEDNEQIPPAVGSVLKDIDDQSSNLKNTTNADAIEKLFSGIISKMDQNQDNKLVNSSALKTAIRNVYNRYK